MAKKIAAKKKAAAKKAATVASATMREVIVQAVEESGKSVRAIALDAGISQPSLARFIHGERDILLDAADKVAKSLGLKLVKDDSAG